jgi:hypothetical protein
VPFPAARTTATALSIGVMTGGRGSKSGREDARQKRPKESFENRARKNGGDTGDLVTV